MPAEQFKICVGFGQGWTDKIDGVEYDQWNIPSVMQMVMKPAQKDKAAAPWAIFSNVASRRHEDHRQSGEYAALWADIDEGNPSFAQVQEAVTAVIGDHAYAIYSTRSADPAIGKRKWRIIVPLTVFEGQNTIKGNSYELVQRCFNELLEQQGLIPDRVTERAGQLCYLPNCETPEKYKGYVHPSTSFFNYVASPAWAAMLVEIRQIEAQERADLERRLEEGRKKAAARVAAGEMSPVDAVNSMYDLRTMLENYGYKLKAGRYLSPFSSSGIAGVTIKEVNGQMKWTSAHGTDKEVFGRRSGDIFDLICQFEYGGNFHAAVKGIADEMTTADGRTITQVNQDNFRDNFTSDQYADLGDDTWDAPPSLSLAQPSQDCANDTSETGPTSSLSESEPLPEMTSSEPTSSAESSPSTKDVTASVSLEDCANYDPSTSPWAEAAKQAAAKEAADLANGKLPDAKENAGSTSAATQEPTDELVAFAERLRDLDDDGLDALAGLADPNIKPVDWLVGGVLQSGATGVLSGEGGAGKTTLALLLASCISSGTPFMGYPVLKLGKVLYLATEGASGIRRRLKAFELLGMDTSNIIVYPLAMGVEKEMMVIRELLRRHQPTMMVVDTWGAQALDVDDNDNKAVYTYLRDIDKEVSVLSPSTVTMFVHHTAKGNARTARGASAFKDAVDFTFNLFKPDHKKDELNHKGGDVCFVCEKQKEGPPFSTAFFKREFIALEGVMSWDNKPEQLAYFLDPVSGGHGFTEPVEEEDTKKEPFMDDYQRFDKAVEELYLEATSELDPADMQYVKVALSDVIDRINDRYLKKRENPVDTQCSFFKNIHRNVQKCQSVQAESDASGRRCFVPKDSAYNKHVDGKTMAAPSPADSAQSMNITW